ncbi:hypothetical protein UA75_14210 [Actinoalloteichus sp. GBA129-24]|uniref:Hydrolase n=1 Tax=Actinoalloteichus fjordicus TaxID=1612552 RepID=A0AAC9LBH6_9PSEU|nr:hypothetical protein UA74_14125 [Actinoalloteichus fjordicus]APU20852.1 hypothetical protein UA75_14210 [Actinoalloteichus sp. GBA129-24]
MTRPSPQDGRARPATESDERAVAESPATPATPVEPGGSTVVDAARLPSADVSGAAVEVVEVVELRVADAAGPADAEEEYGAAGRLAGGSVVGEFAGGSAGEFGAGAPGEFGVGSVGEFAAGSHGEFAAGSVGELAAGSPGRLAAVFWDMDGTLLDSEKLWAIALEQTAAELGGVISAEARAAMVGSNMSNSMGILLGDLGLPVTPESVASAGTRVADLTRELFRTDLLWRPGAQEALHAVHDAGVPMALVTSTIRSLGEVALKTVGSELFAAAVFGDEVPHNKPHPAPYLQAAAALGVNPADAVAVEDSPVGVASAVAAGCTVLVVPCEVPVESGERRVLRESLVGVDPVLLSELLPAMTS